MAVQRVTLTSPDEGHAPPDEVVEITVIGEDIFISVAKYTETTGSSTLARVAEVPRLRLRDLLSAIGAFGYGVNFVPVDRRA